MPGEAWICGTTVASHAEAASAPAAAPSAHGVVEPSWQASGTTYDSAGVSAGRGEVAGSARSSPTTAVPQSALSVIERKYTNGLRQVR